MSLTVRQHYVPRVYLRAWSDKGGMIRVQDKITRREFRTNVDNVLLERYYYEDPSILPNNELERRFGEYEDTFGLTRDFLVTAFNKAVSNNQPIEYALANLQGNVQQHMVALKNFAGISYFRTPGALHDMKEQLSADSTTIAAKALQILNSAYKFSKMGFDSTLLQRFQNMHTTLLYAQDYHLNTADRPCIPISGGDNHSNFGYDIGRHEATIALINISPNIAAIFSPNLDNVKPELNVRKMPKDFVRQTNEMVHEKAMRWIII